MTHQNEIQSLRQRSTGEEYTRPFILLPFQPIISRSNDIFGIRRGRAIIDFVIQLDGAGS